MSKYNIQVIIVTARESMRAAAEREIAKRRQVYPGLYREFPAVDMHPADAVEWAEKAMSDCAAAKVYTLVLLCNNDFVLHRLRVAMAKGEIDSLTAVYYAPMRGDGIRYELEATGSGAFTAYPDGFHDTTEKLSLELISQWGSKDERPLKPGSLKATSAGEWDIKCGVSIVG